MSCVRCVTPSHCGAFGCNPGGAPAEQPAAQPAACGLMPLIEDYAKAVHDGDDAACGVLRMTLEASLEQEAAQPAAQKPIGYMSPKQVPGIADPIDDAVGGMYFPMRKTPAGNFTLAVYAGTPPPRPDSLIAEVEALGNARGWGPREMMREVLDRAANLIRPEDC